MAPIEEEESSLFHVERISQYVSLSPASLSSPLPALCASIFSPLLLTYFPPAKGIVLAYEDVALSSSPPQAFIPRSKSKSKSKAHAQPNDEQDGPAPQLLLRHVDEYSAPFLWASASFLVWRPRKDAYITGAITHASKTHITLAHLNTFPVSVLAAHLPSTWVWNAQETNRMKKGWDGRIADEGGWWVDGEGEKVDAGREIRVRIRDFDGRMDGKGRGKGFLKIEGSLLSPEEELAQAQAQQKSAKGKGKSVLRTATAQKGGVREAEDVE